MNFDPRCLSLNTEMGVLFEDASLIREISAVFDDEASPQDSYRVVDEGGGVRWQDGPPTNAKILTEAPQSGLWRRMQWQSPAACRLNLSFEWSYQV